VQLASLSTNHYDGRLRPDFLALDQLLAASGKPDFTFLTAFEGPAIYHGGLARWASDTV
jgi:hypothetical protein